MRGRFALLVVVVLCGVGVAGCAAGVRQVDAAGVEQTIADEFSESYAPAKITGVTCPDDLGYEKGLDFECSAKVGDATVPVGVTVTDHAGGIEFAPTRGVVVVDTVEADLTRQMHEVYDEPNDKIDVAARCGDPAVRVAAVGEHFDCQVTVDERSFTERITISDNVGNVTYRALQ